MEDEQLPPLLKVILLGEWNSGKEAINDMVSLRVFEPPPTSLCRFYFDKAFSIGAEFFEVSAKENIGIIELFKSIPKVYFEREQAIKNPPVKALEPIAQRSVCF